MTVDEILNSGGTIEEIITALKCKTLTVPLWAGPKGLQTEYDPRMHPVMDKARYPDIVNSDGVT